MDPTSDKPGDDAWVDALLTDNLRGHVADDGFADRVVEQLPATRRRARIGRRELVLFASSLVAAAVGGLTLAAGPSLTVGDALAHPSFAIAVVGVALLGLWGAAASATERV